MRAALAPGAAEDDEDDADKGETEDAEDNASAADAADNDAVLAVDSFDCSADELAVVPAVDGEENQLSIEVETVAFASKIRREVKCTLTSKIHTKHWSR